MDSSISKQSRARSSATLLRVALHGNALFSGSSGLFLMVAAEPAAAFLGWQLPLLLRSTGAALVFYGIVLFYAARREHVSRRLAWAAILLDIAWVAGSAALLLGDFMPLSPEGKWAVAIIADIVALFAVLQYLGIRRST